MSQRGKRFAYIALSDMSGDYEVFVGEELLGAHRDILEAGMLVELTVKADRRDGEIKLFTNTINSLNVTAREMAVAGLEIRLRAATPEALDLLEKTLTEIKNVPSKAMGYVEIIAPIGPGREAHWRLPGKIGTESAIQKALKATKTINEIAA